MKITAIKTGPEAFEIETEDGKTIPIVTHRATLWKQGLVVLPEGHGGQDQVAFQNPDDEESATVVVPNAVWNPTLADWQRRWAANEVKDGIHKVTLELSEN